ncbi:diguanylate cyclase (GGDEF)-like protein [Rhodanobacter sp. ANJX3]|uniref:GGDEF domain-containing protein n=1 Tax=unclassified Rhodanobacter TaxID=2621553 RepID=UPI0015CDC1FD|nr:MULTISPECIES: GGDEF domain-containing protein [unclassified Rhodanobacter]MBB5357014.1 diguanylate cyclase (GGDEF)-like protein [Rhodanobacter sp. ANJX3]NYE27087.1 diguanylate cyclase (GGDEF)-like protein [Rhodanobacter sp. K2T2]
MSRAWAIAVGEEMHGLVLGRDASMRMAVERTVMAMLVYLISILAVRLTVYFGFSDLQLAFWLTIYMLAGPVVFYLLVRSGWSRRLRDPALTMPQNLFAVTALVFAYPTVGPVRALTFLLVALLPLFGFLAMSPRQTRLLAWFSVIGFGAMMASLAYFYPEQFDPRAEALHFVFAVICLPCMAFLLSEVSRMRLKVRAQRTELEVAKARLEVIAAHDLLTGLFNRRYIGERLSAACQGGTAQPRPLCISLIDLDHFKRINDQFGHALGDQVLCHFAAVAQSLLPRICELGRWGGEEFLLLMPGISVDEAMAFIDNIRSSLGDRRRAPEALVELHLTFSAGLVEGSSQGLDATLESVDRALYQAKADGRNRTVLATSKTLNNPRL